MKRICDDEDGSSAENRRRDRNGKNMNTTLLLALAFLVIALSITHAGDARNRRSAEELEAGRFIDGQWDKVRPLQIGADRAWWEAATTGSKEAYKRNEEFKNKVDAFFNDRAAFERVKSLRQSEKIKDPVIRRRLELLYLEYLPRQVEAELLREINRLETKIEQDFATYRPVFRGEKRSQNDLEEILKRSTDSQELEEAWKALKTVGELVEKDLLRLVELRNQAARKLGFSDFYQMEIVRSEQKEDEVLALFEELDRLTREPFRQVKAEIDEKLSERYRIDRAGLRPWHYQNQFFQEAPDVFGASLDKFYADEDIAEVGRRFYMGIGLDPSAILARSSLYEQEGKNPHAFAIDIDRAGDIRVLLNLRPNARWMDTMLHELGHAVYNAHIDRKLPWDLRQPAHTLTTEGYAMMLGRLAKNRHWMKAMGVIDREQFEEIGDSSWKRLRAEELIFSRWAQVMLHFERQLYKDPAQDLNKLWWDLVEKYQLVKRPDDRNKPDYAAKIHIVSAPVYYHNYMMGLLFASQIHAALVKKVYGPAADIRTAVYVDNKQVGRWMKENIFSPGALYHYDELTRRATGEPLGSRAFAQQFLR